jgi:RNA polymerase sigma factor (sigma-70 family)
MAKSDKNGKLSLEQANELVLKYKSWGEAIAKSVARSWSLDWMNDGLDGAAMEALIFCARNFDPSRNVPFKSYARRRIHEAATEAARKSKGWEKAGVASSRRTERLAREISADLFSLYPSLRSGQLPVEDSDQPDRENKRVAIQKLLVSACIISTKYGLESAQPDEALEYKRMSEVMARLQPLHQKLLWLSYWEGQSLRSIAESWRTDELNVIREHAVLIDYMQKLIAKKSSKSEPPPIRPGLRDVAARLEKQDINGEFSRIIAGYTS